MNWNNDLIIIKDNFFEETLFKKIQADLDTVKFENRYGRDKGKNHKTYFDVLLSQDHPGPVALKSFLKVELGMVVNKMNSFYFLSTKHQEPSPHVDSDFKINCIIYLKGPPFINNGTGLYEKNGEKWTLNSHVGFKENRMAMFSSSRTHGSLQCEEGATGRFIMANWVHHELE